MGLFIGDNENLTAFSGNQPLPLFPPPPATSNIRWPWWQFGVRIKVISCMLLFFTSLNSTIEFDPKPSFIPIFGALGQHQLYLEVQPENWKKLEDRHF